MSAGATRADCWAEAGREQPAQRDESSKAHRSDEPAHAPRCVTTMLAVTQRMYKLKKSGGVFTHSIHDSVSPRIFPAMGRGAFEIETVPRFQQITFAAYSSEISNSPRKTWRNSSPSWE